MSLWVPHLDRNSSSSSASSSDRFHPSSQHVDELEFEPLDDIDEHQEPVARASERREITIRRHKDITQEDIELSRKCKKRNQVTDQLDGSPNTNRGREG